MTRRAPCFSPSNWRNALAYYAQGLVVPGGMLARCHKDLLELAPQRLPLLIDESLRVSGGGVRPRTRRLSSDPGNRR